MAKWVPEPNGNSIAPFLYILLKILGWSFAAPMTCADCFTVFFP